MNEGSGKLSVAATESILGVDAKVDANVAALDITENIEKKIPFEAMVGNVSASVRAGFGLTGIGATASITANAFTTDIGPISGNVGFGLSTGAFVSPTQVTVQVLGTGISVGEKTGISILGSGVSLNVGKAVEEVTNHFVHHDPHAHVQPKVETVKKTTEHVLGIDVAKDAVEIKVIKPAQLDVTRVLHGVEEQVVHPVGHEIKVSFEEFGSELKNSLHALEKRERDFVIEDDKSDK